MVRSIGVSVRRSSTIGQTALGKPETRLILMKNLFTSLPPNSARKRVQLMERMILAAASTRKWVNVNNHISMNVLRGHVQGNVYPNEFTAAIQNLIRKRKLNAHGSNEFSVK